MSQQPSLRAKRCNPDCFRGDILDCFVARAPGNDGRCERSDGKISHGDLGGMQHSRKLQPLLRLAMMPPGIRGG
ncbi:hypothetical protein XH86_09175 [Bradyrhizobium guangdongense]|uniref:Uncharacterized protein n=1 Tax=Bradyrhizobium guangdongense TaxID=1325090 RepID=A0ABX6UC64_9BRAD|nr:hypothetical protein X265_09175 [Bradyrhizobium guangdongense]QOZ58890.1 hypothetical protein XH86_09175 [Bradyrhizobium guangdongense]